MKNKITVLLADNESAFGVACGDGLIDEGFEVIVVEDVGGVKSSYHNANALVIDARLPSADLEGLVIVSDLIKEGKLADSVPIIFISVHSEDDELIQEKMRSLPHLTGRYTWLQKPFEIELLAMIIKNQIGVKLVEGLHS